MEDPSPPKQPLNLITQQRESLLEVKLAVAAQPNTTPFRSQHPPTANPATDRAGTFEDVGSSGCIAALPAAVHFGGFAPGALHSQVVRLTNLSARQALRAHVVPPETPYFKVPAAVNA